MPVEPESANVRILSTLISLCRELATTGLLTSSSSCNTVAGQLADSARANVSTKPLLPSLLQHSSERPVMGHSLSILWLLIAFYILFQGQASTPREVRGKRRTCVGSDSISRCVRLVMTSSCKLYIRHRSRTRRLQLQHMTI